MFIVGLNKYLLIEPASQLEIKNLWFQLKSQW